MTEKQMRKGSDLHKHWQSKGFTRRRRDGSYFSAADDNQGFDGCVAVSKALADAGLEVTDSFRTLHENHGDDGYDLLVHSLTIEVKSTRYTNGRLIVKPYDVERFGHPDWYVLVAGGKIAGCIEGTTFSHLKHNENLGFDDVYTMFQKELKPLNALIENAKYSMGYYKELKLKAEADGYDT